MNLSLLQDLHIEDKNFWNNFQYFWANKDYINAINYLQNNQQLTTKYVDAEWFNNLTNKIYQLETVPDWDKHSIVVSYLPPDLEVGDIWFQLQLGDILIDVYTSIIPVGSTSTTITYSNTLINAITFNGNKEVITNQTINESNHTVTFSLDTIYTQPVICMVYSTDNVNVTVNVSNIVSGSTTFQLSYSGSLLSAMYLDNLNNKQIANINIQSSSVNYSLATASTDTTIGRLVYIPTANLSEILHVSNQNFSSTIANLLCEGYMVSCFIKDSSNNVTMGDIEFYLRDAIIKVPQNTNTSLSCTLYYT